MPSYKVKSEIRGGKRTGQVFKPGDSIELSPEEAWDVRHALENPPDQAPGDSEVPAEVLESVRNNPENPNSGVELYWKTQPDISARPESNKTEKEKELEPKRQKAEAQTKAAQVKKPQPPAASKPVVPVTTRPTPAAPKK